ncbi:MAG: ATP-dependent DNA helicase RecG [Chitinophagaceae bacterium]|nr:ATP-dependent DNA helicase RecG [Chitinophagaceae bacterium]
MPAGVLSNPIEYLKGVGPQKADLLKKELGIFTFEDLLNHFPYRHIDKTKIHTVRELHPEMDFAQVAGTLQDYEITGTKSGKRLVATLRDNSDLLELVWFQGIPWIQKLLQRGQKYLVFGRISFFGGKPQMAHPEIEIIRAEEPLRKDFLEPVYSTTEKLKSKQLGSRQIMKLMRSLTDLLKPSDIPEFMPPSVIKTYQLTDRYSAYRKIHFPSSLAEYEEALRRFKFEELFLTQLKLALIRSSRLRLHNGIIFQRVGELFHSFYHHHLPFTLTEAQKKVIKEIRSDTMKGIQMNRLLQGDVGSGKTIVALLVMLLAADNGYQSCLMAPTEILAQQHFANITRMLSSLPVNVGLLTGSAKLSERKKLLDELERGELHMLIGTHALIEDAVKFHKLGLVIIDEQHRFGVAQRARLWKKSEQPPHVLVMTATPIPRTLAMTVYGDLDCSILDELPPGRQKITTVHRPDTHRSQVMNFIRQEIDNGRQAYIIFPLIEESETLDYENLMKGYENVKAYFPEPRYRISVVHGRQPAEQREVNMKRFAAGDTQIMVSTTVIEVGVDVPNATIMVIESAEKFGLSQLHQLRGRVGRGNEKSYCILMTAPEIGKEARERIKIMTSTNSGFEIAEKDLELRGPGEIEGTKQSGILNFKVANLVKDKDWLERAKDTAVVLVEKDPELNFPEHQALKHLLFSKKDKIGWSKIS